MYTRYCSLGADGTSSCGGAGDGSGSLGSDGCESFGSKGSGSC
jgi:hypothetical protein